MPLLWNKNLETGIPEIDVQHKNLIDSMNQLLDAIKANQDPQAVQKILSSLSSTANLHFGYEEMCMHRYKCPIASKNKELHALFVKNFGEIRREFMMNGPSPQLCNRIDQELLEWFGGHIKGIDTQLKPCMN